MSEPQMDTFPPVSAPPAASRRSEVIVLALITLAALAGRLALAQRSVYPSYDGAFYLNIARSILHGSIPFSSFPPGWPSIIAFATWLYHGSGASALLASAQMANAFLGVLSAWLLYDLARPRFGRFAAVGSAIVLLILPLHVRLSVSDLSEISYACVVLAALTLQRRRWFFASGLMWGFAYTIRPEALMGWAALVGLEWFSRSRGDGPEQGRRSVANGGRMVAGCAVLAVPYLVFLWTASGSFQLSSKTGFLFAAYLEHPGLSFVAHYFRNASRLAVLAFEMLGPVIPLLAVLGLVKHRFFAYVALVPLLLYPLFTFRMAARYLVPYVPFIVLAAIAGLNTLPTRSWTRWPALSPRRATLGLGLLGLIIAVFIGFTRLRVNDEYFPGMRLAGLWLAERETPAETLVVGRKPYVSFWAGCAFKRAPAKETTAELLDWAESVNADYLVVHAGLAGGSGGATLPLLERPTPEIRRRLDLAEVFTVAGQPNETTLLFRLRKEPPAGP